MNHTKKTFRFYIALWMAKLASFTLKVLKRNATNFPGKVALTICPDFLLDRKAKNDCRGNGNQWKNDSM